MLVKDGLAVKVIWVEVPISTFWPPVIERLEEETVKEPKVVVPMPPFDTASRPVTSLEPRLIALLNKAPAVVLLTGRADDRLAMVVEPLVATDRKETPEVEATTKIGRVWAEEEAWTTKEPLGVVEFMPKDWGVLSQTKLADEAVLEAPVA